MESRRSLNVSDREISDLLAENIREKKPGKKSFLFQVDECEQIVGVNDDILEKKKRREENELRKKTATDAALKPKHLNLFTNLTQAELEEHYTQCIRMCNQNKVNAGNAFKLQLIDYMKVILMTKNKMTENLSLMSCTLDASAKIYSCRVEKVYSDMMKLISGKEWAEKGNIETDNNDNTDDEERESLPKKKKKTDNVEKNGNIDMEKMLWSEMRLDKNEAETETMNFINFGRTALPPNSEFFLDCPLSDQGQILLNCQLFNSNESSASHNVLEGIVKKYSGSFDTVNPAKAIPGYLEIYENEKNVNLIVNNNFVYDKDSDLIPESVRLEEDCDVENNTDDDWQVLVDYDECMSDNEGIEPTPVTSHTSTNIGQLSVPKATSFSVNDMSKFITTNRSDYGFFDNNRLNFLAGPAHWSVKAPKNKLPKVIKSSKVSKKNDDYTDFNIEINSECKKCKESSNSALTSKTMKMWSGTIYTVPFNVYNQHNIVSLMGNENLSFLKNDIKRDICESGSSEGASQSLRPEDFLINDEDHKVHHNDDDDGDVHDDYDDNHDNDMVPSPASCHDIENCNNSALDLVPPPPKVNKIAINYAKVQKRVDIRLLKSTIWDYMKLDEEQNHMEEINLQSETSKISDSQKIVKLSDVYKALPENLPEEEAKQLSMPLVFMAVLHMANEKNLHLSGDGHNADVSITLG